ncbi:MAG: urate catabolism protein [Bradyrhizobium sp.]|nr:urate catabolism protein [Bradyrhizobium sp.]
MSTKFPRPKANTPLPYAERHLPWDKRKGAKVFPNGARMAFIGYFALEQWDWNHPRVLSLYRRPPYNPEPFLGKCTLDMRTLVKYGAEIGMRRIKEMLEELKVPFSMLVTGSWCEDFPEITKELADIGCEMNAHTWSYSEFFTSLDLDGQRDCMKRTVDIIKKTTGYTAKGWLGQSATCDENTIQACADMDFLYHADLSDDELPYFIDISGKTLVEVPYRMMGNLNDYLLTALQDKTLDDVYAYLKQSFDASYRAAGTRPLIFNYGAHPFVSGRPDTAEVWFKFMNYVKSHDEVWIASIEDVANHWKNEFNEGYPF